MVKKDKLPFILCFFTLAFQAPLALAEGMLAANHAYSAVLATGAVDSRAKANDLLRKSHIHREMALGKTESDADARPGKSAASGAAARSGDGDHDLDDIIAHRADRDGDHDGGRIIHPELQAKAEEEYKQGVRSDHQARSMAQAALASMAMESLQRAAPAPAGASPIDLSALQQIASTESPFAAQGASDFPGLAATVETASDASFVPITPENSQAAAVTATDSSSRSPASVPNGLPVSADVAQPGMMMGMMQQPGPGSSLNANDSMDAPTKSNAPNSKEMSSNTSQQPLYFGGGGGPVASGSGLVNNLRRQVALNQARIRKQMGLSPTTSKVAGFNAREMAAWKDAVRPIGDNLFSAIHRHYESMNESGGFYGSHLPSNATPPTPIEKYFEQNPTPVPPKRAAAAPSAKGSIAAPPIAAPRQATTPARPWGWE